MVAIRGTANWCWVTAKNPMSNKYSIDICNLDKDAIKTLKELGIKVRKENKDDQDRGSFITAKSKMRPRVIDAKKNALSEETLIGNGSKVKVSVHAFDYTYQGKAGVGVGFKTVQVLDLVRYVSEDEDDFFFEEDGFTDESSDSDDAPFDSDGGDDEDGMLED